VYVLKRPGVDEFLERVAKDYEVDTITTLTTYVIVIA
jgi:TFIIF-interacting CTD phosphatase-like protein